MLEIAYLSPSMWINDIQTFDKYHIFMQGMSMYAICALVHGDK